MSYMIMTAEGEQGPLTAQELAKLQRLGQVGPDTMVRKSDKDGWFNLSFLDTELRAQAPSRTQVHTESPAAPYRPPLTPAKYLEQVRNNSNYPTLRQIINICCGLVLTACGVGVAVYIYTLLKFISVGEGSILPQIIVILGLTISMALTVAMRQAALLLVDLADMAAERNSRD